ncbi:hypothetical protein AVEN_196839-1 [Araneus ventricosus]|uniref:Uncharacterized protein n=1 Tax=Araneus ventricosus TaxID=182803 RepID=A0A4Y2VGG9_ARAVE|nr:hypothetical protein AVEN_63935-1 [Araneus ventricosus]GBO23570.1 hypothetical protein AVEN_196839-1 [Araneus ventricosus]
MVGIPSELKSKRKIRATLKEASEKNNALRRLKPRFEDLVNLKLRSYGLSFHEFRPRFVLFRFVRRGRIEVIRGVGYQPSGTGV